jgi:hypothetical protein
MRYRDRSYLSSSFSVPSSQQLYKGLSNMPTQKSTATKIPKDGWVQELGDAESAAKKSHAAGAQLRLAIAAYKLREFKKVKIAANLGLALDPSESEKELLKEYVEKSKEQKERVLSRDSILSMYKAGANCDVFYINSAVEYFSNLNILQYAVMNGDVTSMEEAVALGAAIDLPVADINAAQGIPPAPAPPGSTALLLVCALLAMISENERIDPTLRGTMSAKEIDTFEGCCECAIQLVYLGANCQVKLQIPARRPQTPVTQPDLNAKFRALNFDGKTVQELASISCRRDLIRAIEIMQNPENVLLTQCRCGSRLPCNQCHGAPVPGQSNIYILDGSGRPAWRYSPKATCPCNLTNKEHYKCCWFTSTPSYKSDSNGEFAKIDNDPFATPTTRALRRLQHMRISEVMHPDLLAQGTTLKEFRSTQIDLIRSEGLTFLDDFNGCQCGVKDWDPMVYAGIMDCIDNCFTWTDLHWRLTKVELLQRTKEWNEALEKYCDDMGLTGAERQAVTLKHTANPCAPCSNPSCYNWETKPKQFQNCSQCKAVVYCSRDCQKKDWKAQHKSTWCVAN